MSTFESLSQAYNSAVDFSNIREDIRNVAVKLFVSNFGPLPAGEIAADNVCNARKSLLGLMDFHGCWAKIERAIAKEGKIPAIRLCREYFGYTLLEAKCAVENYAKANDVKFYIGG